MRLSFAAFLLFVTTAAIAAVVPHQTTDFVDKVAVSNKFEIDTSRLALQYARNDRVKEFAQQMITGHEKAGNDFKAALKQAAIDPPSDRLDVPHTARYVKLRAFTTEAGFDRAYVDEQVSAHEDAVSLFRAYSADGPTMALKAFATDTLPALEGHLRSIKEIQAALAGGSAATGAAEGTKGR